MTAWRYAHWVFLAAVLLLYAQSIVFVPIAHGDQFQEIVASFDRPLDELLSGYLAKQFVFFRPLELFWRKVVLWMFGERLFAYNLFQLLLLAVVGGAMTLSLRVRSPRQAIAALFALACLFGYHGFHAVLELNLLISNFVVLAATALSLLVLTSRPHPWNDGCAIGLSLVAMLTKEVGILVPFIFLFARFAGFAVPSRRAAVAIATLLAAFIAYRLFVVLGAGELQDRTYGRDARDLAAFAANVLASFLNILCAAPKAGDFGALFGGIHLPLWRIFQILTPLLAFLLVGLASLRERIWRPTGDAELRRWVILLIGVVGLSSALGFFYPVDRNAAIVAPLLAYALYVSVQRLLAGLENRSSSEKARRRLIALLAVLALASTMRVAGGYYFLIGNARLIQDDWVLNMAHYQEVYAGEPELRGRYLEEFRSAALGMPRGTRRSFERELFGSGSSIAR
jgi:hypothetical protein